MTGLSRWAVRRPLLALIAWLLAVGGVIALGSALGGTTNDSFSLPNTPSSIAQGLLSTVSRTSGSPTTTSGTVVWSPSTGTATDDATKQVIAPLLESIRQKGSVRCVTSPWGDSLGRDCPKQETINWDDLPLPPADIAALKAAAEAAAKATSTASPDGRVAYSTVTFDDAPPSSDIGAILEAVSASSTSTLAVGAAGEAMVPPAGDAPSSDLIGIAVAVVILLIAFASLIAAGLPIVVAGTGILAGQLAILVVAKFLVVPTFAPTLAAMIGLGVGIDYALFVLNRFRQDRLAGLEPRQSALNAVNTAGRAVLFAGTTVIIALFGLLVLQIEFFNGLAIAAAVMVVLVMLSALWMLPALLSLLGDRALGLRLPWARTSLPPVASNRWSGYGRFLQRAPWLTAAISLGIVVVLAIPSMALKLGFPDNGSQPEGTAVRVGYDLMSEGFGPGVNGPFFAAVTLPSIMDTKALGEVIDAVQSTPGVASTLPTKEMLPLYAIDPLLYSKDLRITALLITPTTGPDDDATAALLTTLRTTTDELVYAETGAGLYIGGTQAVIDDFTTVLRDALPVFLAIVVGLGFLALMLLFRSLLIPLTAAVTSLLSFGAALGVTVAVFQWGWAASILGVTGTGPILPFLPVMVFAILFGLSMDYQVFLVSRMQEAWLHDRDPKGAVRLGLGGSGRVVVIAALIMSSVFLAFVPTPNDTIKLFGVALATAVIVDAFVIRLVFVPSLMSMAGRAMWWLPGWLDRRLPHVDIEGTAAAQAPAETPPVAEPARG